MFERATNVQLSGRLLKSHYPNLTVMHGVEHTVSLFSNYASKIPILHQIIPPHKTMYNIFSSGIYHNPHFILKKNLKSFKIKTLIFLI